VHTLLNSIEYISYSPNSDESLDQDLIKEIKVYLDVKGRLDW
jgi:hypothetical protein